jgi:hypothetical protein
MIRVLDDDQLHKWLESAMPLAESLNNKIFEEYCPFCHKQIRFPLIVRKRDVEAMNNILEMLYKYAGENGVTEKVLADILKQISNRLNLQ